MSTEHPTPVPTASTSRWSALDRLRAVLTVLVVAHHAVLAYHPYAPPPRGAWSMPPTLWQAFPVVDPARSPGVDWLVGINDSFFMALMFLIGGWFVCASVKRSGARNYIAARTLRLGLPFVVSALLLAPLAYYPSYLQNAGLPGFAGYWQAWERLLSWPAGPAWFLVALLLCCVLAALALAWFRGLHGGLQRCGDWLLASTWRLPAVLLSVALLSYLPMAQATDAMSWWAWGPFTVQSARVLLYPAFFAVGMALGAAAGSASGLLRQDGALARRWWLWLPLAVAAWWLQSTLEARVFVAWFSGQQPAEWLLWTSNTGYAVSCALWSLACMALVARLARRHGAIWQSLCANAYAIYLLHYVVVVWLQYALLRITLLPGWSKALLVSVVGLLLSWALAALLRRVPGVARVLG